MRLFFVNFIGEYRLSLRTNFRITHAPTGTKDGKRFTNAEEGTKFLLEQQGISTVPWDDVGAYLRFSATFDSGASSGVLNGDPAKDDKFFKKLDERLGDIKLMFD